MQNKFTNAKPFLFDRSFDDPTTVKLSRKKQEEEEAALAAALEAARIEAETPPVPTFSEEELATAKADAFEEGRQAGIVEANNEIAGQVTSHMELITAQLAILHDKQQLVNETHAATLAQLTGEITSKLLPFYAHNHGAQEIVAFVRDCIAPIMDDSQVTIRLGEAAKDFLEDQLQQVADEVGFAGHLLIIGDASMGPADTTVDWNGGGAERNWDDIWDEINEAIAHATHSVDILQKDFDKKELLRQEAQTLTEEAGKGERPPEEDKQKLPDEEVPTLKEGVQTPTQEPEPADLSMPAQAMSLEQPPTQEPEPEEPLEPSVLEQLVANNKMTNDLGLAPEIDEEINKKVGEEMADDSILTTEIDEEMANDSILTTEIDEEMANDSILTTEIDEEIEIKHLAMPEISENQPLEKNADSLDDQGSGEQNGG